MRNAGRAAVALGALAAVAVVVAGGQAGYARSTTAPTNESPPTISGSAREGETLRMTFNGSWDGTTPMTFAHQWLRCDAAGASCNPISGATSTDYTLTQADVGSTVRLQVTASNSDGSNSANSAQTAKVADVASPIVSSSPTISGTTRQGQTLTVSPGSWSGSPSFTYQWRRCNSSGTGCANVGSATTDRTYRLGSADVGHAMRVLVTASNAGGSGSALTSPTAVVVAGGNAPANSRAPYLTGTLGVGKTIAVNVGTWVGTTPITFAYGWERCDSRGANCSRLAADGSSYVLRREDANHTMRGIVTASNADGRSTAVTRQTGLVPGAPVATAVPKISGSTAQGQTLSATAGTWSSATKLTLFYQWVRCDGSGKSCSPIDKANASRYTITNADVGHRLFVQVKGHNAYGDGFANSAQTAVIGGTSSNALSIGSVSLPERLVVDKVSFSPTRITSHAKPLTLRAHVATTHGRPVQGALVYAIGVPYNRLSKAKEVATDGNGWATVVFDVESTLQIRRGNHMVLFVRARRPGDSLLAGVSTRRLVSVRVG